MTLIERLEVRTINVYYHHYNNTDVVCITRTTKGGHITRDILRKDNPAYQMFISQLCSVPSDVEIKFHHHFHDEDFLC